MRKYALQWSLQGVLILIGFGVDLIPNVNTWIPSIIVWTIAFIWAIISIIFWAKTKGAALRKGSKQLLVPQGGLTVFEVAAGAHIYKCTKCGQSLKVGLFDLKVICPNCGDLQDCRPKQ